MSYDQTLLLLSRPRRDSEAFLSEIRKELGWAGPALIAPVLEIEAVDVQLPQLQEQNVILASPNAVPADGLAGANCFVVGQQTAAAVRDAQGEVLVVAETEINVY